MKLIDVPPGFPIPFASAAAAGFIRPIPQASQIGIQDGAASLTDGFVPDNFLPVGAGGVPPFGQDFNGLLKQITQWNQWSEAGAEVVYNSAFSTGVGGYPQGSTLAAIGVPGKYWISIVDDNTVDPDAGASANWGAFVVTDFYAVDSGAANALVAAFAPAPVDFASMTGRLVRVKALFANTTVNPTINFNGFGGKTIVNPGGSSLYPGQIAGGAMLTLIPDGTNVQLVGGSAPKRSSILPALTSGSGNYTPSVGTKRTLVRMVGPGGSSGGSRNGGNGTDGATGTNTSFGSTTALAGVPGKGGLSNALGGQGGINVSSGTTGTGTEVLRLRGAPGGWGGTTGGGTSNYPSGGGASSPFGGGAGPVFSNSGTGGHDFDGQAGGPNTGGGASGGSATGASSGTAGGGAAGEYVEFYVDNPVGPYAWVVGAAGTPGSSGIAAGNGALGGSGVILIEEIF